MPVLQDEKQLTVDGFISTDPALHYRQQAQSFIASRKWSTTSVFYGDQIEPDEESKGSEPLWWSMCFALGLDHITTTDKEWRADVDAVIRFFQKVQAETGIELIMEVRYSSKQWYSATITFIDNNTLSIDEICAMIERV
jgi:hypothetical protein